MKNTAKIVLVRVYPKLSATVRYAEKLGRPITIVYPNGAVSSHSG